MSKYDELEELFGLSTKAKKKKNVQVVDELLKKPVKDNRINMPHFQPKGPGITQQADLLFLPDDNGYKYALVVIDVGSKKVDAEPLTAKDQHTVLWGFKEIYKRKILKIPSYSLEVDNGTEFGGVVKDWFVYNQDHHILVRVAKTGRHRQQGLVERANQAIGKALFRRMDAQELLTGQQSKEWTEDLPKLISVLNNRTKQKKKVKIDKFPNPVCSGKSCELIPIGTKVRVILEEPRDPITGLKLPGRFRTTDRRWDPKERTVKQVLVKPAMPPLYLLDSNHKSGFEAVTYTRNQLQMINKDEQYPEGEKVIRGKPETYIIEEIVGKTRVKGKIFYKIKWRGFKKETLEPRSELIKDQKQLILDYEKGK